MESAPHDRRAALSRSARFAAGLSGFRRVDGAFAKVHRQRKRALVRLVPWALRCLAVLDEMAGDAQAAADRMLEAAALRAQRNLAIEALEALVAAGRYEQAEGLAARLPTGIRRLPRVKALRAAARFRPSPAAKRQKSRIGD